MQINEIPQTGRYNMIIKKEKKKIQSIGNALKNKKENWKKENNTFEKLIGNTVINILCRV